jgi:hypothetical protein
MAPGDDGSGKEAEVTPHAATLVSEENQRLFARVESMVSLLPDLDLGRDGRGSKVKLSCHMLCRALGKVLNLKVVDGFWSGTWQHSWLMTPDDACVIDPYPPGTLGGPILVDAARGHFPGRVVYKEGPVEPVVLPFDDPAFLRSVDEIEKALSPVGIPSKQPHEKGTLR